MKILDAVKGTPAGFVPLKVNRKAADGGWTAIASGFVQYDMKGIRHHLLSVVSTRHRWLPLYHHRVTDATGEIHNLITEEQFSPGVYRVEFDTKAYWKSQGSKPFHELAEVSTTGCFDPLQLFR